MSQRQHILPNASETNGVVIKDHSGNPFLIDRRWDVGVKLWYGGGILISLRSACDETTAQTEKHFISAVAKRAEHWNIVLWGYENKAA